MLILVLNCGGSTLKFKVFRMPEEEVVARGEIDRLGSTNAATKATFTYRRGDVIGFATDDFVPDHLAGMTLVFAALTDHDHGVLGSLSDLDAVAHKLAHGGERFSGPVRIDNDVVATLNELSPIVPLHNPPNLRGIEVIRQLLPHVPQFGAFETSFHQTVPRHARIYGVPFAWFEQHQVRKYGFHSASHRYVSSRFTHHAAPAVLAQSRIISCHLGSGTSVCAIKDGRSLDISSGLTPQSGTMMSTRPGDVDPFVITYMMRRLGVGPDEMDRILTRESGLLGISGISGDLRDLEQAADPSLPARGPQAGEGREKRQDSPLQQLGEGQGVTRARAQLAIDAFCYRIRSYIGAFYAELGGLDTLVFTGGIGENSPLIRAKVCAPLKHLGIRLDETANQVRGADCIINAAGSRVAVHVIATDEELIVARDVHSLLDSLG